MEDPCPTWIPGAALLQGVRCGQGCRRFLLPSPHPPPVCLEEALRTLPGAAPSRSPLLTLLQPLPRGRRQAQTVPLGASGRGNWRCVPIPAHCWEASGKRERGLCAGAVIRGNSLQSRGSSSRDRSLSSVNFPTASIHDGAYGPSSPKSGPRAPQSGSSSVSAARGLRGRSSLSSAGPGSPRASCQGQVRAPNTEQPPPSDQHMRHRTAGCQAPLALSQCIPALAAA